MARVEILERGAVERALDQASIVVAEDDLATRALLRATLERADYAVRDFDNGADALIDIQRTPPDVALLDIGMAGMDGLEVTRALRRTPSTALLPIILVTARGRIEDKVGGLDAGASDFVTKPFEPVELLARVRANLRLSSALRRLEATQDVLVALASAVDAKDPATEHHCGRVAERALQLARLAGLDQAEVEAIGYGAVLHDVGKIGVREDVLRKPGVLTDEERAEMQRHPLIGAEILRPLRLGRWVSPIVRAHHERWDGRGYPDGLRGDDIPIGARIVGIVDAYDAMTHDRPYRAGMSDDEALEELRRNRGAQFDPELTDLFVANLGRIAAESGDGTDAYTRGLRDLHEEDAA
jgi:putative two-component system response regulator